MNELPKLDTKTTKESIIKFIQDKVSEANAKGLVVGLSGGIDSTLTAYLATEAVGKENVFGIVMPSTTTPTEDKIHGTDIAKILDIDYKELEKGNIKLPIYRTLYLDRLLENLKDANISKDDEYKKIVKNIDFEELDDDIAVPKSLNANLRLYQKIGFKWLKSLDEYGLGGILADDMGLGKTVQLLALILDNKERDKNTKPSIVVSPSSLTLNWQAEINKFASSLKVEVIHGSVEERSKQISEINNYDVVITSYDLLKRDIDFYKEENIEFKYIIADEAQYIKNNNTQNSKAIKEINAKTKFALTGTPIENSLSELWSIFDFIMPRIFV